MDQSINSPVKQNDTLSKWVWFEGSEALLEGQAVCYNYDYNSAAEVAAGTTQESADARRGNYVELPSVTNAQWFAGVSSRAYAANSTGQFIEIYLPGSKCNILILVCDADCGTNLLTFDVTDGGTDATDWRGYFRYAGLPGEGSAVTLQDVNASALVDAGDGVKCQARLQTGPPSGGVFQTLAVDNLAITADMVGGTTLVVGVACTTGDTTAAPADTEIEGLRKAYRIITTNVGTNNLIITPATLGIGTTDVEVSTISIDTVGDAAILEFLGNAWNVIGGYGMEEA